MYLITNVTALTEDLKRILFLLSGVKRISYRLKMKSIEHMLSTCTTYHKKRIYTRTKANQIRLHNI